MARRKVCGGAVSLAGGMRRRRGGALRLAGGSRGRKIMSFLKKAHDFAKKNKILSRGTSLYGMTGMPYSQQAKLASPLIGAMGYGRKRRRCRNGRRCK